MCYVGIPMNVFGIMNVTTIQHRMFCTIILMNVFGIMNVATMQRHIFYAGIPMNVFAIANVTTTQLGTSCAFDSPGLARNKPTPGKRSQGDSTP